ncbi:high mobility group B protein 6-like [Aristolochia californica]|uniref:high mobility group B protein 6-like n=1 Tax=Aristolochia californica TaxID=171875 RepID=UPI0035E0D53D
MADIAAQVPTQVEQVPSKKGRKSRKALKPKNAPETGANVLAWQASKSPLKAFAESGKENLQGLSTPTNYGKVGLKPKESIQSFADQLLVLQKKLEQMQIEKKKTEELLKERDELLKRKEEELENRGREQEKLQKELKTLQKLKEFKPSVNIPVAQSLREKEQEKKEKKGGHEIKRPCPPYSFWCKDQWKEVKKENPDADFKEISNIIGARWKKLTSEGKKPYEEKYHAAKEIYLRIIGKEKREQEALKLLDEEQKQKTAMELLDQYLVFKQEMEEEGKKRRKKQRDPLRPKHPMSAFFLFSNDRRAALLAENKNLLEVSKMLGEEWSNMKEHKKAPYEEIARKQKEEYLRQMEIYKQKKAEEAAISKREEEEQMKVHKQEALQLLKKKEKTENIIKKTKEQKKKHKLGKNVDPNRPRKPATSFLLFSKETRKQLLQERPGINNSTLRALVSVKWKEMSEDEKELWKKKASKAMEAYRGEMEEYNKLVAAAEKPQPS